MEKEGIGDYFVGMITGDMVTEGKPSPEIYQKACELLAIEPPKLGTRRLSSRYPGGSQSGMVTVMVPDLVQDSG